MKTYLEVVDHVLREGEVKSNERTGEQVISSFGVSYKVDIREKFPLLTTKKVPWGPLLHELLWYLSGEDHIRNLQKHTKIWDAWADENGDLDTAYGRYWRRFPSVDSEGNAVEIDQLAKILETLRSDPTSRRMVLTAWEPNNAWSSKLPPCHFSSVFNVNKGYLNCHLTQRSCDIPIGGPFNLACYSALTYLLAHLSDLKPGYFYHSITDAHIYMNQMDAVLEWIKRVPKELPTLSIADSVNSLDNISFDDFKLEGYDPHPYIKMPVAV